ncbi:hypothetical protein [Flavobacterium silvaticum]|uniref:TonB-dependent receptor n=1 Tax=Flavobacterium silvaticum TaxID=1852020 RepID=A0A972FLB5_9FLAO|nr:hypothetical protein [Flavobacterium silvaticum]NMH27767.1 hypothetical protein [Flavobacterium silvaticum]
MPKKLLLILLAILPCLLWAQQTPSGYISKKVKPERDTIRLENFSINPERFELRDPNGKLLDSSFYKVDFAKGIVVMQSNLTQDSLTVSYQKYPDYLTKTYSVYDPSRVVSNENGNLYQVKEAARKPFVPFEGLNTSGSITRGITVGNNQNAVTNSALDLQIVGKISDKVSLRASIQDSNVPLQEGGYSQKLDEFDQIFIELFSDKWKIRAGDLFLENRKSRFLNFNKKVQGISTAFEFGKEGNKTFANAAVGLVRGQYARSQFTGQEGNQGPYKLRGPNGELYILVISGSERVYVNGVLLQRGESEDYVIDYNAGEITFTSLFPITSEMRINVEYQYSDRNFTRFVTYAGVMHERKKWSLGTYVYSENDVKNQPLQQNLTPEQAQILADAGDDPNLMTAPSAYVDTYSENKILYRKILVNGLEVYEYSNDQTETLYNVRFTLLGNNLGNYVLTSTAAIGKIYEYVAPIGGIPQGNYEPIIRLIAPVKLQIATIMGKINPSEKTLIDFEGAISNNDLNLFSNIQDDNNRGLAGRINAKQRLLTRKEWNIDAYGQYQFVQKEFRTIERLFNIEFDRDWNLANINSASLFDQSYLVSGVSFTDINRGTARYQFENLGFGGGFNGSRHLVDARIKLKKWDIINSGSYLSSTADYSNSSFLRNSFQLRYRFGKNWVGGSHRIEDNHERINATGQLSALSQKYNEFGGFIGRGDSTRVFVEIGYLNRTNDSLQNGFLSRVNRSNSYYLKSRLISNDKTNLSLFVNYRSLKFEDPALETEPSLNSRLLYNDRFFDQLIQVTGSYENTSGTIAQQEFTYVEVEPGQGIYTWNDYNGNGIQELEEFEVAPYPDLAKYVRVFLPNQIFLRTHQNRFSASGTFNFGQWQNKKGFRKFMSYFYDQISYLTERKIERNGNNFDLDPFSVSSDGLLGLNQSFRNSLFYNRGKQKHSTTYTYVSSHTKSLLSVGAIENTSRSHQFQYAHLVAKTWLFSMNGKTIFTTAESENYEARNYEIDGYQFSPKISYLFSKNASWDIFYERQQKDNEINDKESLGQDRFGTSFSYTGEKKFSANGEFSLYKNKFDGDSLSPVAYQMLEGLQAGQNLTWRFLLQKNLTQYLDVNVNYQGRKSETSKAIHTGSVQLRAFF